MSVPIVAFECTSCDLHGSSSAAFGRYRYLDATGVVPLIQALGICDDCHGFRAIESFGDAGKVRGEILLGWILVVLSRLRILKNEASEDAAKELTGLNGRLRLIRKRKGDERCLTCGGRNVVPFTGKYKHSVRGCDHESKTGFIHPKCGGEILYKVDGSRIAHAFKVQTYSFEGKLLKPQ
jgi:hypothetical protein